MFGAEVDIVVVGAGHAGVEAALAAARAGCRTLVLTPNLDRIGFMPCNPSIGGPGKSHLVAEIDALGGEMARAADRTALQVRRLNTSRGPAVQAIRIQADKMLYAAAIKEALETHPLVQVRQDDATGLMIERSAPGRPRVTGVNTRSSGQITAGAVVITAGTFLRGSMITGDHRQSGGRAGDRADHQLSENVISLGLRLRRLKTGTPPRLSLSSVDFTSMTPEHGSTEPLWLSRDGAAGRLDFMSLPALAGHHASPSTWRTQLACFKTGTTEKTHDVIRANLHRAPMYTGAITGTGPRYCPSIEDKVGRFADKTSHPVFLEPEGWRTTELYVQGMSTSLPPDVQQSAIATIPGLERARITRFGYAVEYDAIDPAELTASLETRRIEGLFLAGQINGTSGYEEAAGQGLVAGLNAANHVQHRPPVEFRRDQAYIGVMIDDLVSKPFDEPYRMLTSRAEYRLLLRTSTADRRLAAIAHDHNLITTDRYTDVVNETDEVQRLVAVLAHRWFGDNPRHATALQSVGLSPSRHSVSALELLRQPSTSISHLGALLRELGDPLLADIPSNILDRVEQEGKYGSLIEKERLEVSKRSQFDTQVLPLNLNYREIVGLRHEARQKLLAQQPHTIGQATRIAGITPSDIAALLIHARRNDARVS